MTLPSNGWAMTISKRAQLMLTHWLSEDISAICVPTFGAPSKNLTRCFFDTLMGLPCGRFANKH